MFIMNLSYMLYERLTDKGLQPYFGEYDYLKIKEKKQQASQFRIKKIKTDFEKILKACHNYKQTISRPFQ